MSTTIIAAAEHMRVDLGVAAEHATRVWQAAGSVGAAEAEFKKIVAEQRKRWQLEVIAGVTLLKQFEALLKKFAAVTS